MQVWIFLHFQPPLFWQIKILFFLLECKTKIEIFRGYCGGKDPNLYIGPWALFDDVDMSEEEKTIGEVP